MLSFLNQRESLSNKSLIDTPTCSIKYFDPFNISTGYLNQMTEFYCPSVCILTYDTIDELYIIWRFANLPPYNNTVELCTYTRPKKKRRFV